MKAYIKTYGCTLNQADGDMIGAVLSAGGVSIAESEADADIVVLNTCTVKEQTHTRIVQKMHDLSSSGMPLLVTGCMAGANQDIIRKHAPSASIVSVHNMSRVAEAALSAVNGKPVEYTKKSKSNRLEMFSPTGSAVARVPINDGCLSSCGFCETRYARGSLNSFSEDLIVKAVESSVRRGAKEIDLTSQDTGAYGRDRGTGIAKLMHKIALIDGDFMARVGMMNPEHLKDSIVDFAEVLRLGKFYLFAHIPVQSGSDRVLEAMGRSKCTVEEFEGYVSYLRKMVPGITIETDVIVGFPGESEADFDMTLDMLESVRPDVTNVSRFTKRPHARASMMPQVDTATINERSSYAAKTVRKIQSEINSRFVGERMRILITEPGASSSVGRDSCYRHAVVTAKAIDAGATINAKVYSSSAYSIICAPD